jgi:aminomethyltransferase
MKTIPLHDVHVQLGAKMVPFAGFEMPVRYTSDLEEHHTIRQGVGVFDVSHMGEFVVKGPGALSLIQKVSANDASVLYDGKVQYSYMPNATGGVVDDLLVYRYNENEYYLVVNASNIEKDWNWINSHATADVELENISDRLCLLAVQGPKATATLQKLTETDLSAMEYYTFTAGSMAGIDDIIISATGYTGSGGFELYVWAKDARALWDAIFEAGSEFGIKPVGLGARDTLRLEKGYCLYGNDIDDTTSPLEAGLGWVTKFTKDFVNSDALKVQKEQGPERKLVGFELLDKGIPRSHYELCTAEGIRIGEVTSGSISPTLQKGIGMGYVPVAYAKPGTELYIRVRDRLLKAQVIKLPFVK